MHRVAGVACMGIASRPVVCGFADVRRSEFTAAVVATIDDALPDRVQRDLRFVIVHRRTAGHIVHVSVMHTRQR